MSEDSLDEFIKVYNIESIVNKPIRYKNHKKLSWTDLTLVNKQESFLEAKTIKTGLSYFHKMVFFAF